MKRPAITQGSESVKTRVEARASLRGRVVYESKRTSAASAAEPIA